METKEKSKFEEILSIYLYQLSIRNFRSHHRRKKEQRKRPGWKLIEYARPILVLFAKSTRIWQISSMQLQMVPLIGIVIIQSVTSQEQNTRLHNFSHKTLIFVFLTIQTRL